MTKLSVIVMAAGLGKRMKSKLPKMLHPVAGRPMLWYMVNLARQMTNSTVAIVIGHGAQQVRAFLKSEKMTVSPFSIVSQREQRGTGHAVLQAKQTLMRDKKKLANRCLILNGDTPLLTEVTVRAVLDHHQAEQATITILTTMLDNPQGYGRVVRGAKDTVIRVVEDQDASPEERLVKEVNVGTYVVEKAFLFDALSTLVPHNAQEELYLTDIIHMAVDKGLRVSAMKVSDHTETLGINNREQLAFAEKQMRYRICHKWMHAGVTILDPDRTRIDQDVMIGQDTVLYPEVSLEGQTRIGEDCLIRSQTRITDSTVEDRVVVQDSCVIKGAMIGSDSVLGPFAHIRPETHIGTHARVGNFCGTEKNKDRQGIQSQSSELFGRCSHRGKGEHWGRDHHLQL